MKQLALPGLEHRAKHVTPEDPFAPPSPDGPTPEPSCDPLEGQLALFDDLAQTRRELDAALDHGDFEQALELRERLLATYGGASAEPFEFLDTLAGRLWERSPREVFEAGLEVEDDLVTRPALAARVRRAVVLRLVARHGAEGVLAGVPEALPAVCNALGTLASIGEDSGERRQARRLVRDTLRAGRGLAPLAFDDPAVRDLLAEDLAPRWLACLGVVRRLWPVTPGDDGHDTDEDDDDARADAFWRCLAVAEDPAASDAALHDARKRMRRLHPTLHALYLRRLV